MSNPNQVRLFVRRTYSIQVSNYKYEASHEIITVDVRSEELAEALSMAGPVGKPRPTVVCILGHEYAEEPSQ